MAQSVREILQEFGIASVFHVAPLHYLPAIVASGEVGSKKRLKASGLADQHFRRTSRQRDKSSGFSGVVHLMSVPTFPLLKEKLRRSLPHVRIEIPTSELPDDLLLCRYNIAKHRMAPGTFREGPSFGYLREPMTVPVASGPEEARSLLQARNGEWVEVLVRDRLLLGSMTIACFSSDERSAANALLDRLGVVAEVVVDTSLAYSSASDNKALSFVRSVAEGECDPLPVPDLEFD